MADREFKIKITSEADISAARSEADALREVGKSGTQAHKDISEASGKTEVSHRALRVILGNLGPEFAHVGHEAIFAFANPVTAGAIGLTLVIGALIKHFENLDEAAKKAAESLDERLQKFQSGMRKVADSIDESDKKFADWYLNLDRNTGAIIKRLETIKERIAALPEGIISKPVLVEQATEGALREARSKESAAKEASLQAQLAAENPVVKAQLEQLPNKIAEGQKRVAAAQAEVNKKESFGEIIKRFTTDELGRIFGAAGLESKPGAETEADREAKREALITAKQAALEKEQQLLAQDEAYASELKAHQDDLDQIAANKKKEAEDYASQVKALETAQGKSVLSAFSPEAVSHLENIRSGGRFAAAISGEEAIGQGQQLGASQSGAIASLVNLLKQHGATQDQIIRLLQFLQSLTASHKQKLDAIEATLKAARPT